MPMLKRHWTVADLEDLPDDGNRYEVIDGELFVTKRAMLRSENVAEYWVVDLEARTIERSMPADARVEVLADEIVWQPDTSSAPLSVNTGLLCQRARRLTGVNA